MKGRTPWNQGFRAKETANSVPEAEGKGPRWLQGVLEGAPRGYGKGLENEGVREACLSSNSRLVAKKCPTPCHPMACSPPGSSVQGISQARVLEWVAISFSRGSSQPRDQTHLLHWQVGSLRVCTWEVLPRLLLSAGRHLLASLSSLGHS